MRVINLGSGSDGNLTYLENDGIKVLIDAGISCTEITKRLALIGVRPSEIDAIFVTHEHSDHIKGLDVFASKYNIPVYAHEKVWISMDDKLNRITSVNRKVYTDNFDFKGLNILPVEVPHDVTCFGYSFEKDNRKVSILTDLGHTNDRILGSIANSQLVYLESNYDKQMLINGTKYPLSLKRRIDGPNGHLSNDASADAVEFLAATGTRQIVLAHLSKENNSPDLAYENMCEKLEERGIHEGLDIKVDVASPNPGRFFRLR